MDDDKAKTDQDLLREAFEALLRGDTAERDRICARLKARQDAREKEHIALAMEAAPYFTKQ